LPGFGCEGRFMMGGSIVGIIGVGGIERIEREKRQEAFFLFYGKP